MKEGPEEKVSGFEDEAGDRVALKAGRNRAMSSAIRVTLARADTVGGGALDAVLTCGRGGRADESTPTPIPPVRHRAYHGLEDGDFADDASAGAASAAASSSLSCRCGDVDAREDDKAAELVLGRATWKKPPLPPLTPLLWMVERVDLRCDLLSFAAPAVSSGGSEKSSRSGGGGLATMAASSSSPTSRKMDRRPGRMLLPPPTTPPSMLPPGDERARNDGLAEPSRSRSDVSCELKPGR